MALSSHARPRVVRFCSLFCFLRCVGVKVRVGARACALLGYVRAQAGSVGEATTILFNVDPSSIGLARALLCACLPAVCVPVVTCM